MITAIKKSGALCSAFTVIEIPSPVEVVSHYKCEQVKMKTSHLKTALHKTVLLMAVLRIA